MSVHSGNTFECNLTETYLTLPYQTKVNNPFPNPAGGYINLAQPGVTLPQHLTQTLVARLLIYQNLVTYIVFLGR